jgi:hypothetical protein
VNDNLQPPTHAAWASREPRYGTRAVSVTRTLDAGSGAAELVAIAPLTGTGRPGTATLDDALAVLGYTRVSAWAEVTSGLLADVEPVRGGD